jgi:small subunit ribosomal protein S9
MANKYIYKIGRRKTAVATVRLFEGKGDSQINGKAISEMYVNKIEQQKVVKPFTLLNLDTNAYYFSAKTNGGGISAQLDAVVMGISRALASMSLEFRTPLKRAGLLTRDPRMVERKKTGLRKARKREQYSKR